MNRTFFIRNLVLNIKLLFLGWRGEKGTNHEDIREKLLSVSLENPPFFPGTQGEKTFSELFLGAYLINPVNTADLFF